MAQTESNAFIRFIKAILGEADSRGVLFLGIIGILAVAGVLAIALGEDKQTKVTTGAPASSAAEPQSAPAPTATITETKDSNPITVLAAIATAAVGGLAGALKGSSAAPDAQQPAPRGPPGQQ